MISSHTKGGFVRRPKATTKTHTPAKPHRETPHRSGIDRALAWFPWYQVHLETLCRERWAETWWASLQKQELHFLALFVLHQKTSARKRFAFDSSAAGGYERSLVAAAHPSTNKKIRGITEWTHRSTQLIHWSITHEGSAERRLNASNNKDKLKKIRNRKTQKTKLFFFLSLQPARKKKMLTPYVSSNHKFV